MQRKPRHWTIALGSFLAAATTVTAVWLWSTTAPARLSDYEMAVAALDTRIAVERVRAEARSGDWMPWERVAQAHYERARLTGEDRDYAAAETALARAFDAAPAGAGPYFSRARLHYTLHRWDEAGADLARSRRPLLGSRGRAALAGLGADLAVRRGEFAVARAGYQEALELDRSPDLVAAYGLFLAERGASDYAESLLLEAAELAGSERGLFPAWVHLQLGYLHLERGDRIAALARYREADARFTGWPLVAEHIAAARAGRVPHTH